MDRTSGVHPMQSPTPVSPLNVAELASATARLVKCDSAAAGSSSSCVDADGQAKASRRRVKERMNGRASEENLCLDCPTG